MDQIAADAELVTGVSLDAYDDSYRRAGLGAWPDRRLARAVAHLIAEPKAEADSFVLHAPLELLARVALLGGVRSDGHHRARLRLSALGTMYALAGPPARFPKAASPPANASAAGVLRSLVEALRAGDLDAIDAAARWLVEREGAAGVVAGIAEEVVSSLAAAAHASILLTLWPRLSPEGWLPAGIIRGSLRELGRHPEWRLRWFEDPDLDSGAAPGSLADALADITLLGSPGSNLIQPLLHQAEESGLAPSLLAPFAGAAPDVPAVRRDIGRVAAQAMLQEPSSKAYGWSHCFTLPQAVTGLADYGVPAATIAAVAGTHIVGFRTALGTGPLDLGRVPPWPDELPPASPLADAVTLGSDAAAAAAWHTPPGGRAELVARLVTDASVHHDAHLVKYTLACVDAAAETPADAPLYLAAAASLHGWWAAQPDDGLFG